MWPHHERTCLVPECPSASVDIDLIDILPDSFCCCVENRPRVWEWGKGRSLYSNPEQEVGGEDGEQCLDFQSVLKVGSMGFPNGVAVHFRERYESRITQRSWA